LLSVPEGKHFFLYGGRPQGKHLREPPLSSRFKVIVKKGGGERYRERTGWPLWGRVTLQRGRRRDCALEETCKTSQITAAIEGTTVPLTADTLTVEEKKENRPQRRKSDLKASGDDPKWVPQSKKGGGKRRDEKKNRLRSKRGKLQSEWPRPRKLKVCAGTPRPAGKGGEPTTRNVPEKMPDRSQAP